MAAIESTGRIGAADRVQALPPYLFVEIDRVKKELAASGREIFDLGIGDPDLPTPAFVVEALAAAAKDPSTHRYPDGAGLPAFREAVAAFYKDRFGVTLDPATEVLALIGSKEGIGHLPLAVLNPGDLTLVPDPGYPVYSSGTTFAGAIPHLLPLRRENGFLPDLKAIPDGVLNKARLLYLNYPNNPTGAIAGEAFYRDAIAFASRHGILLCHDAAYSEITYEGPPSMSVLQIPGARETAIEMHSFSKIFNMTGWRCAFAVGRADVLAALGKLKNNMDSGVFTAVQRAGIAALSRWKEVVAGNLGTYRQRRDLVVAGLQGKFDLCPFPSTFYGWIALPKGENSGDAARRILQQTGVVLTPGRGFGENGEGYLRLSITSPTDRLARAVELLRQS